MEQVLVGFSGGSDSVVLLYEAVSVLGPERVRAVVATSPIHPTRELAAAEAAARFCHLKPTVVSTHELSLHSFRVNGPDRCRICKTHLFSILRDMASSDSIDHLVDGLNATEIEERTASLLPPPYLRVESPLAEAGLTSREVRCLVEAHGLPVPSAKLYCLASRVSTGIPLSAALLTQIERAEAFVEDRGFTGAVVRLHSDGLARIKVPASELDELLCPEMAGQIAKTVADLGFSNVAVDLDGM